MPLQQHSTNKEWACRILLTILFVRTISGYIAIWQTDSQLTSPLIPKSTVYQITFYLIKPCLFLGVSGIVALWTYFLNRKTASIAVTAISIAAFEVWVHYFPV